MAPVRLDALPFCPEHFISTCYQQIDKYTRFVKEKGYHETTAESMRHFLTECTRQVADLSQQAEDWTAWRGRGCSTFC